MAEQQIQGVPEGLTEEPIKQQPTAVQGVPEGLTEEALPKSPKPAGVTKAPVAPVVIPPNKGKLPPPATKDILTQTDEMGGLPPAQAVVAKAARGVRGLYHGVMGDEENAASKGETTTASPEAANLGFTPEHVGYKAGEMVHGIGKFIKEGAQDIVGNEPIVIPDKGDTHGFADPKAHTLMSKYVTAPSMAERQASQDEMQKYFETKGPAAAGHAISAFLHGTLGEYVPAVGPLAMALTDQAQKGDLGGALAQIASLYAFEKGTGALKSGIKDRVNAKVEELTKTPEVKQAEANVEATAKPREAAQAKYDAALAEHNKYSASHAQGIDSPKPVKAALDKAKAELDEHTAHHELAQEHLEKTKAAQPTIPQQVGGAAGRAVGKVLPTPEAAPEVPADKVEAAPVLTKLGAPKPPAVLKPINVKRPGEVQPETFPQTPKERPQSPLGRISLANDQGTMGKPPLLTEGTPIGPQVPKEGLPKIELPKQEVLPPEKPVKPERGNVKALTVDDKGNVQDKEETPEGRIGKLLQEALKPENIKPKLPENYKPENDQIGVREKMEHENAVEKVAKEDAEKTAAKAEEKPATEPGLMKTGEEGRELPKSAAEYHPAVQEQVTALPDEKLRQLAKAHGLNPDEYDFKARDEGRHRTERDQLAKDITEQMGEDEKINIGRQAEGLEHNAAMANKTKAERAASLFPRLRGPVDEFGNPKISGGAPEGATQTAKDVAKYASDYNKVEGLPEIKPEKAEKSPRAKEIADEYAKMKHDPSNPEVKKSYAALIDDVKKQWDYATKKMGIKIEPTDKDPYGFTSDKPAEKQLIGVWRGGNELPADHPLAKVDPKTGETYNTMFRAVHDIFGHVAQGHDFSEPGEESAWNVHRQMMSPEAVPAMTTETRGQTSWFFNHGEKPGEFAEQKAGILPDFANESTPDSKGTLEHIRSGKDYAVLTAENPNNTRATPEENTKRNQALVADLRAKGYEPVSVEGNTKDVEGQKEHSFFVPDIKPSEAAELGRKHGQAAVLTTEGLHDLKTDTVNPSDNKTLKLGEEARKEPYYTKVGDQDFSVPIDFNKTVKPGEAPFSGTEKRSTERKAPLNAKETEDAMKNRKSFQNPFDVTEGANETIARDKMMPKHPSEEAAGKPKNQQGEPLSYEHNQDQHHVITTDARGKKIGELVAKDNAPNEVEIMSNQIYDKMLQGKGRGADQIKHLLYNLPDTTNVAKSDISTTEAARGAWDKVQQHAPEAVTKETYKDGQVQYTVDMDKWRNGEGNLPKISGGSQAGTAPAKVGKLPAIAEEHLTEEERAGVTKSEAGHKSFVEKLKKLPSVQEFTDIAKAGEGGRKWYQRSAAAFDALAEEAPKYFKEGDRQKFTDFLASTSPQQSVKMNLGETLNAWTHYVDEGRPEGKELEKLLKEHLTLPGAKIPNSMKALAGEPLWPDLSKNANFKVPSFAKNLSGYLNHVTNDGWQALFGGLDAKAISKPTSYHPLAVVTRAAAEALGWEPAEAQAAIWAFTKTFTEKGETEPADIRRRSEDFADILAMDPEIRKQLAQLGVNHEQLDAKLRAIGKKPPVTPGASSTTADSVRKLSKRIEAARGKGTIPPPKSGSLNFEPDEEVGFNPEDFGTEEPLEKLGRKKSPLGRIK